MGNGRRGVQDRGRRGDTEQPGDVTSQREILVSSESM